MLRIQDGHYNLDALAGIASNYTEGHELPVDIYVYGADNGRLDANGVTVDALLDDATPHSGEIARFLNEEAGVPTVIVDGRARDDGAFRLGLSRSIRDETRLNLAAAVAVFALFSANERTVFTPPAPEPVAGEYVRGDYVTYRTQRYRVLAARGDELEMVRLNRTVVAHLADVRPERPTVEGRARVFSTGTVGVVTAILDPERVEFISDAGARSIVRLNDLVRHRQLN